MTTIGKVSWLKELKDGDLTICVDLSLYPLTALFRVCYSFTDRCYLFLTSDEPQSVIIVHFARKLSDCDLASIAADFSNELINQRVRYDVAKETGPIRELIVAQAFAEADLLDRSGSNASYLEDPKGIINGRSN
jgi:His-Xaa-Ser system protein HxsD